MTEQQFEDTVKWQLETFGEATPISCLAHLREEVDELELDIRSGDTSGSHMEFADCFILLFGAAGRAGMSYADICTAVETKMAVNRKRKWGKPEANGVVNHIKS